MAEGSFFAYISRMRYIARWGLMRNSFSENIQEHSHMVAVLAHGLAVIGRDVFGKNTDPEGCAVRALFHDSSEIFTGDLPTPVKYQNRDIMSAYKQVEETAAARLLSCLPDVLKDSYEPLLTSKDDEINIYVKAADRLAAYIKCIEELRAGNDEFKQAAEQTRISLEKSTLPEVSYFMDHFIGAFGLTLDEL